MSGRRRRRGHAEERREGRRQARRGSAWRWRTVRGGAGAAHGARRGLEGFWVGAELGVGEEDRVGVVGCVDGSARWLLGLVDFAAFSPGKSPFHNSRFSP